MFGNTRRQGYTSILVIFAVCIFICTSLLMSIFMLNICLFVSLETQVIVHLLPEVYRPTDASSGIYCSEDEGLKTRGHCPTHDQVTLPDIFVRPEGSSRLGMSKVIASSLDKLVRSTKVLKF